MAQHASGMMPEPCSDSAQPGEPIAAPIQLTTLRSATGKLAVKVFRPDKTVPYGRETLWHPREVHFEKFRDFSAYLAGLDGRSDTLVVLGSIAEAYKRRPTIRRRSKPKDGEAATLVDAGSRVIHLDYDDMPLPEGCGWDDPEDVARQVWHRVGQNVPALRDVSVRWQASSSAGMPGKAHLAKLHFWILLDRPIETRHRKALLILAGADPALACVSQPNYTACPVFEGVRDPLIGRSRSGDLVGLRDFVVVDEIAFPSKETAKPLPLPKPQTWSHLRSSDADRRASTLYGEQALTTACKAIAEAVSGTRNTTMNRESYFIGTLVAAGHLLFEQSRDALLRAGEASGHARFHAAVSNGLSAGLDAGYTQSKARQVPQKEVWADKDTLTSLSPTITSDPATAIQTHTRVIEEWGVRAVSAARAKRLAVQESGACQPALAQTIPRVMLSGAQGVGKTSALVGRRGEPGLLHGTTRLTSILFVPDLTKAAEALADYRANPPADAPPALLIRGRTAQDPEGAPGTKMCQMPRAATEVARQGVPVISTLCAVCPFRSTCGYLKQQNTLKELHEAEKGLVLFASHDYAFIPLPGGVNPDLVIFDERPRDFGVAHSELSFEALTTMTFADLPPEATKELRAIVIAVRNAGQDDPDRMLEALRAAGISRNQIVNAMERLGDLKEQAKTAVQSILRAAIRVRGKVEEGLDASLTSAVAGCAVQGRSVLAVILRALLIEIDLPRPDAVGLCAREVSRRPGSTERALGIRVSVLKPLWHCDVPFLHLDGTGSYELAERLFGTMIHEHHRVERTSAERGDRVTQVTGREFHNAGLCCGRNALSGEGAYTGDWEGDYAAQNTDIQSFFRAHPGAFVAGNKKALEALQPEQFGAVSGHFGALRGRNR